MLGSEMSILKAPRSRTSFLGREREGSLLIDDLENGAGLVTVTGLSGIGKTRLAQRVVQEIGASYEEEGGAWFCGLTSCSSAADVEAAVASLLGIPFAHEKQLERALANRGRMLLVLDGLDGVAATVGALLSDWLGLAPELQILATSVVPIGLDAEVRFELGPMSREEATALYLERADRARGGVPFAPPDREAVEQLVARLDRVPLAIELAAARALELPPRTLLSRFDDRFELLLPTAEGRQTSLFGALRLSWELLSEEEQALLLRLSVFEGGFTVDAAIGIQDEDTSELEMLDRLDGLRAKAMLSTTDAQPPRFFFMESVRDFARRKLDEAGLREETLRRLSDYLVEHGERRALELEGPHFRQAIAWIEATREDLVGVLSREGKERPAIAARAGLVLFSLLNFWGYSEDAIELLVVALDAARRSGDETLIARVLICEGIALGPKGRTPEAVAALEEAVDLLRRRGDREAEGNALARLAYVLDWTGDVAQAKSLLERAQQIGREVNAPHVEATALLFLGLWAQGSGDFDEAERCFEETLAIVRRHGMVRRAGIVSYWLGSLFMNQGRFREARRALHEVLVRSQRVGNRWLEANTLTNLGATELAAGLLSEGERYSLQALSILRENGDQPGEVIVLGNLGCLALVRGEFEVARARLLESLEVLDRCGEHRVRGSLLAYLGLLDARTGALDRARDLLAQARRFFEKLVDRSGLATLSLIEGCLELAQARGLQDPGSTEAEALVSSARARLRDAQSLSRDLRAGVGVAIRLLSRDLEEWDAAVQQGTSRVDAVVLRVGAQAAWFQCGEGERVDLRRRLAIRRMLDALVEQSLVAPGSALEPGHLFQAGWPDVQIAREAAMRRVYWAIWTLRDLGLAEVLLGRSDGYLLDPALRVVRARAQIPPCKGV